MLIQWKWSKLQISSWKTANSTWWTSYGWCLQRVQSGCGCCWLIWNLFFTHLLTRCNCYWLFYWNLESAIVNRLKIYRDVQLNEMYTVEYFDLYLSIVHDLVQARSPSTLRSSCCIPALPNITWCSRKICFSPPQPLSWAEDRAMAGVQKYRDDGDRQGDRDLRRSSDSGYPQSDREYMFQWTWIR